MPAPLENGSDDDATLPVRHAGCAGFELESGDVVIYETSNPRAWIQSDEVVDLDALA